MNRLCMGCMRQYDDRFQICPYCGYQFNTPAEQSYHIAPGSILNNRYIVGKVLGYGGFGVTYLGWDFVMERRVAVKEYLPSEFATRMPLEEKVTIYSGDKEQGFREGLEKMLDEARRLAKFDSVPGIVQIYDCFEANRTSYLIMEYLEGVTLKEYLEDKGPMTEAQAIPVILQIAEAMEAVHRIGILHRDIAPDNIRVLNPEEPDNLRVKLLDFGAARYATTRHSKSLSVIIKQGYAPVEQYSSHGDQGPWSDVYALAATLYRMLTGITPEDAMEREVQDEVKRPSRLGIKLTRSTEAALMNAMHVGTGDRTQTMEAFCQELTDGAVEERSPTKKKGDGTRLPRWLLGVTGAGLAAAALGTGLVMTGVVRPAMNAQESHLEDHLVRVPNVINLDVEEAQGVLRRQRLDMVCDRAVYSDEIPRDRVCFQAMKENMPVERYSQLVVWISNGEQKELLPYIKGLPREEALKLLEKAGFANIQVEESQEEGVFDTVLAVSEAQGEQIPVSRPIVVTVCRNRASLEEKAEAELVEAPDLSGMQREEAGSCLRELGLRVNWVEDFGELPENTVLGQKPEPGTRIAQGAYVTVTVSKGPELVKMDSLQLMTLEEARDRLGELGLEAGTVKEAYSDSVPAGKVIAQSVKADQMVKAGAPVQLTVSKGKDPVKVAQEQARRQEEEASLAAARQQEMEWPGSGGPGMDTRDGEARKQAEAAAAESQRQAEAAAAAEAQRQAEAAAAESQRQAEAEAAAESQRQAEAEAAAEAQRQAEAAAESQRQVEAAAAAEAQRQAEAAAAAEVQRQAEAAAAAEAQRQAEAAAQAQRQAEEAARQSQAAVSPGDGGNSGSRVLTGSGERTVSQNVKMKNLKNKTLEEAQEILEDQDLVFGGARYEYSDSVEEGCVISQSIKSGKSVKRGSSVSLTVSKGPSS